CRFPLLMLITMRGEWEEFNPWQVPMGSIVDPVLKLCEAEVYRVREPGEMAALVKDRGDDLLVVPGLGSTTWDLAAAGDDPRNFYLWGAMGGAAMIGL